ncbi:MAG: hypothetical protein WCA23_35085 [Stellaceae bacterium]
MQQGMAERNAGSPPEKRIEFRVGVNLGDVIAEEASTVCHELRSLCPRNAKVINIEVAQEELHLDRVMPEFSLRGTG